MSNEWKTGTLCIQGGYTPKVGEPRILPIIQSTTYKYEDLDQVAAYSIKARIQLLRDMGVSLSPLIHFS